MDVCKDTRTIVDDLIRWQLLYRQDADDNFEQFQHHVDIGQYDLADECEETYSMRVVESDLLKQLVEYLQRFCL